MKNLVTLEPAIIINVKIVKNKTSFVFRWKVHLNHHQQVHIHFILRIHSTRSTDWRLPHHTISEPGNTMIRGVHKVCGHNAFILEPYMSSLQLSTHLTSAKTYSTAQKLPRLPVPKLDDTLSKYLKTAKPHLNNEEYDVTCNLAKDFATGVGQDLQSLLEKRAQQHTNWLEEWWLNTAYLEYRDPVVVYSSPGLVFPFRKFNSQLDQLQYAAKTLLAALDYKSLIDNDKILTEMMGKNPLDMQQYKKIFGTCRIPGLKRDSLSYNTTSKHVTIIHNNHIFHVDLWGNDGKVLNEDQIVQQLQKVIEMSNAPSQDGIGILTSENRNAWAKAYDVLIKDNQNKDSLKDVQSSLVVLCLDKPVGLWKAADKNGRQNIAGAQTIHGGGAGLNGGNRWFDKTVQFIVGADGVTGLTYEHSPAEGQPIAVLTDFLIDFISLLDALQGLGVDRHLLGLKLIALENGVDIHKLYSDPGYVKSTHMRLSTSQVACKCDGFMCYGPLVSNGYATCYNPRDNDVNFATSAFNDNPETSCDKYRGALEQALQDMHDVLLLSTQAKL
ncbi:carnitine O-acetyltransferase-like [Cydia strobilella]|uniref:carnitine O-acetyltransferase-like n=1 Tax=Cydia strobilella TaxID=1100964 RepID=UPI003007C779